MFHHFVLQVSQTLSLVKLATKLLPSKGATDPNKPARMSELSRALLPQLFAQFLAHSSAEEFELLNTHNEDATKRPRPTNKLPHNRCDDTPSKNPNLVGPNFLIQCSLIKQTLYQKIYTPPPLHHGTALRCHIRGPP